jgi:hypothetical protein
MGGTMSRAMLIGGEADRGLSRAPAEDGSQPLIILKQSTTGQAMYGYYHGFNAGPNYGYSDGDTNQNEYTSGIW